MPWYSPMVIMQRQPEPGFAAIELQARIPAVLLVGSILLGDDSKPLKDSYVSTGVPVSIPPVAAVELIPGHPECRVPLLRTGHAGPRHERSPRQLWGAADRSLRGQRAGAASRAARRRPRRTRRAARAG